MNPSVVHSKRFIVSAGNLQERSKQSIGRDGVSARIQVRDPRRRVEFDPGLPECRASNAGPVVTYGLFQVLNGMTDGVIAAVIILISLDADCDRNALHSFHDACDHRRGLS